MNEINEQQLADSLAGLPRERSPRSDLWPGIEARLQESVSSNRSSSAASPARWIGIAAMLAIAVVTSYQVGLQRGSVITGENLAALEKTYHLDGLSNEYIGAIREAAALTAQQTETRMSAETVEDLQTNMKNLLQTETMLREAIKADPENEFLARLLVRLQSQQLKLIQDIPHIEQQIWRTL